MKGYYQMKKKLLVALSLFMCIVIIFSLHVFATDVSTLDDETYLGSGIKNLMGVSSYELFIRESKTKPGDEYYAVMRGAQHADCSLYCIIEHSFHSNANAAYWLLKNSNLQQLAELEASIINDYYKNN